MHPQQHMFRGGMPPGSGRGQAGMASGGGPGQPGQPGQQPQQHMMFAAGGGAAAGAAGGKSGAKGVSAAGVAAAVGGGGGGGTGAGGGAAGSPGMPAAVHPARQPRFDYSEFPALGAEPVPQPVEVAPPPSMVQAFRRVEEDFPALGSSPVMRGSSVGSEVPAAAGSGSNSGAGKGSQAIGGDQHGYVGATGHQMHGAPRGGVPRGQHVGAARGNRRRAAGMGVGAAGNAAGMSARDVNDGGASSNVAGGPAGAVPASVPSAAGSAGSTGSNSASDRYGLAGLLPIIRMTDPDLNTLALGSDLTTLGLNLNSPNVLYGNFVHPCQPNPTTRHAEYVLPPCYYAKPPALKTSHLGKFHLETLFYIFYNMPQDTLQVYAARELYNRDWRYHKELKLWFTRPSEATLKRLGHDVANGSFIYLDINLWEQRLFHDANIPGGLSFSSVEELQFS